MYSCIYIKRFIENAFTIYLTFKRKVILQNTRKFKSRLENTGIFVFICLIAIHHYVYVDSTNKYTLTFYVICNRLYEYNENAKKKLCDALGE